MKEVILLAIYLIISGCKAATYTMSNQNAITDNNLTGIQLPINDYTGFGTPLIQTDNYGTYMILQDLYNAKFYWTKRVNFPPFSLHNVSHS